MSAWSSVQTLEAPLAIRQAFMTIRPRRETVLFAHRFRIRSVERLLPAGACAPVTNGNIVTKEDVVADLAFTACFQIANAGAAHD